MEQQFKDQEFLEYVVKSLADHPEAVKVKRVIDEMGVLLTLEVDKDDMRQIIGRKGATAKAIRSLLKIVGLKNNARVNLKILEPEGGLHSQQSQTSSPSAVDQAVEELSKDL